MDGFHPPIYSLLSFEDEFGHSDDEQAPHECTIHWMKPIIHQLWMNLST
jgi:hypothetical protein